MGGYKGAVWVLTGVPGANPAPHGATPTPAALSGGDSPLHSPPMMPGTPYKQWQPQSLVFAGAALERPPRFGEIEATMMMLSGAPGGVSPPWPHSHPPRVGQVGVGVLLEASTVSPPPPNGSAPTWRPPRPPENGSSPPTWTLSPLAPPAPQRWCSPPPPSPPQWYSPSTPRLPLSC